MKFSTWIIVFSIWLIVENGFIKLNDIRETLKMCEKAVPYDPGRKHRIKMEGKGNFNYFDNIEDGV